MSESITSAQKKQYLRFVEDAAEKALDQAKLDKESIQRLIEKGGDFQSVLVSNIVELGKGKFADEEVKSNYAYPKDFKVKDLTTQGNILRMYLKGVGFTNGDLQSRIEKGLIKLPRGAEGWYLIPPWQEIASHQGEAVKKVLAAIKTQRQGEFYNFCDGKLGSGYLREIAKTARMFQRLRKEQGESHILIVPAQFGFRHRGRSVRRAREVMSSSEFELGAFAVGCMLLTHPERLMKYGDLGIDCTGDEFSLAADGRFDGSPYFDFGVGWVGFVAHWAGNARERFGSASGFLP